jgi:hypothetical protein
MTLKFQILDWNRNKNVMRLNRLMGSNPSSFENWTSSGPEFTDY